MASKSYRGETRSGEDTSAYTHTAVDIGAADPTRLLLVLAASRGTAGQVGAGLTIGGTPATVLAASETGSGTGNSAIAYLLPYPTGTTADIVASYTSTQLRATIRVYALYGVESTPFDTAIGTATSPVNFAINNPANGLVVAFAACGNPDESSPTISGVTEDGTRSANEFLLVASGSDFFEAAATDRAASIGFAIFSSNCGVAVSFTPSAGPPATTNTSLTSRFTSQLTGRL